MNEQAIPNKGGRYREGVLYSFSTTDDVNEFSKSRFNPLITSNREDKNEQDTSTGGIARYQANNWALWRRWLRLFKQGGLKKGETPQAATACE